MLDLDGKSYKLFLGDCIETIRGLPDNSISSICTDPPYELGFMGKAWDSTGIAYNVELWRECLRVLKPGGHLLAFSGSRTYHRMACAIEDAGFEIRDMIAWVYGSGFPKSLDVSKAIDKRERGLMVREKLMHFAKVRGIDGKWLESHGVASAASFTDWTVGGHVPSDKNWSLVKTALGVTPDEEAAFEREVVCQGYRVRKESTVQIAACSDGNYDITAPATDAARQWEGWGTALKPALEPITVARKPLVGTVAENVLSHGTGALNIDGCRVPGENPSIARRETAARTGNAPGRPGEYGNTLEDRTSPERYMQAREGEILGRWPANLIHDGSPDVVALFPDSLGAGGSVPNVKVTGYGDGIGTGKSEYLGGERTKVESGSGSAARFFYQAKVGKRERNEGLPEGVANNHPCLKPVDLLAYLCRLVTPPGGVVLDPFLGSGSTGKAAIREGFRFIGCELSPEYLEIARARIEYEWQQANPEPAPADDVAQLSLFA